MSGRGRSDEDPDLLAELIGDLPAAVEPPNAFDTLDTLLNAPEDVRNWGLRKLIEVDHSAALRTMFPDYTLQASAEFGHEYLRQQRNRRVRRALDEEEASERLDSMPEVATLSAFLAEPDEDACYRVDGLWPREGRVLLTAQNKAGKTTLTGNLLRSLVDGDKFLDTYPVESADRVVLLDNELSPRMVRRWLRDQRIQTTDAVSVVSLRGQLSKFNLLDPSTRSRWADALGSADVLIFDCLRPALDALGLSEDKDAGRFLEALDELCRDAGITEMVVVHHMGHSNERSRGDSRILDWPDAIWKLVREDADDPMSARFFSAYGRDVDHPEVRLAFDSGDRHLSVNGGSRRQTMRHHVEFEVLTFVENNPGCSQSAIEREVTGDRMTTRQAIRELQAAGTLRIEIVGQARRHFVDESG